MAQIPYLAHQFWPCPLKDTSFIVFLSLDLDLDLFNLGGRGFEELAHHLLDLTAEDLVDKEGVLATSARAILLVGYHCDVIDQNFELLVVISVERIDKREHETSGGEVFEERFHLCGYQGRVMGRTA